MSRVGDSLIGTALDVCFYCGLPLDEHDDSGCCPLGTEQFGGRR